MAETKIDVAAATGATNPAKQVCVTIADSASKQIVLSEKTNLDGAKQFERHANIILKRLNQLSELLKMDVEDVLQTLGNYVDLDTATAKSWEALFALGQGTISPADATAEAQDSNTGITLVNPDNPVPDGYDPDLVDVEDGYQMNRDAAGSLNEMLADCRANGGNPQIISGYRTQADQEYLYKKAGGASQNTTAKPGYSEHQTGKAVDILETGYGLDWDNASKTAQTKTQQWLTKNCANYGYVLRYPEGKEKVTGIGYESWHYTYVGSPEVAHKIMDNDLTVEEYLGQQ